MMTIFEQLLENPEFKSNLEKLPEDERKEVLASLKQLTEQWEKYLLVPIKKLK
jgi:hypothetical protein